MIRVAALDSFATPCLTRLSTEIHGFQPWLHSYAATAAKTAASRKPHLARSIATIAPEVTLVSGDFVSARVLQNKNIDMTRCDPRRRLSPGRAGREELARVVIDLNIDPGVCRPLPADVAVGSNSDTSALLLNGGRSVIAVAVACLVVAELWAAGPTIASHIAVEAAIGIRPTRPNAVLIGDAVARVLAVAWMIVLPIAAEAAVRDTHLQRLLQTKCHQRFGGNIHAFAAGQDLSAGSRCRPNPTANCRAFSAAANGADDRADRGPCADEGACPLIGSETVRPFRVNQAVLCLNAVTLPVDRD